MIKTPFISRHNVSFDYSLVFLEKCDVDDLSTLEDDAWGNMAAGRDALYLRLFSNPGCYVGLMCNERLVGSMVYVMETYDDIQSKRWFDYAKKLSSKNSQGDCLYLVSFTAHPDAPKGVGRILLDFADSIARLKGLQHVSFGSRIPCYHRYHKQLSVHEYVSRVKCGEIVDSVLSLIHVANFEIIKVIADYYEDPDSLNYGVIVSHALNGDRNNE